MFRKKALAWVLGAALCGALSLPVQVQASQEWVLRAEQGDAKAQYLFGGAYYNGVGVPQSYKQAAHWYRQAAEQGDADAQYLLGLMYYNGQGVPQDAKQAAQWLRKAAEQGVASAQGTLGGMYGFGEGVPQSYKHSYAWLSVAVANGDGEAKELRDYFAQKLSPSELSEAQVLAAEYFEKYQSD